MVLSNKARELKAAISDEILSLVESRMPPVSNTVIEIVCELIDERIEKKLEETKIRELAAERELEELIPEALRREIVAPRGTPLTDAELDALVEDDERAENAAD